MEDRTGLLQSKMLVGDRWIEESDGGVMTHLNPATGQPHKTFPVASAKEVGESVDAAREAFESWRRFEPDARRDVLRRIAALIRQREDEIGSIMSQESGSLYSPYNARYVAEWFDYYAGWADKISGEQIRAYPSNGLDYTIPEPVGVVAALVTWNGPLGFCGMAGAPALAAGCTIVVKSPELAPFSPVTFGEVCLDAGLPPGVVNVIHGGPDVGDSLIRHPEVDKVTFTGGTATAKKIQVACAETLTPLVMELGGKSANIVFDDAGIERSINFGLPVHRCQRTGVLASDAAACPGHGLRRSGGRRGGAGGKRRGGRPLQPRDHHGPGHQRASVQPDTSNDRRRGARRRFPADGRQAPGRTAGGRFFPCTHSSRRCGSGYRDCTAGDLRTRSVRHALSRRIRSRGDGQCHTLRTGRLRPNERFRARKEDDRVAPGGQRPHQRERAGTRVAVLAVRWGEAQWIWPSRRH